MARSSSWPRTPPSQGGDQGFESPILRHFPRIARARSHHSVRAARAELLRNAVRERSRGPRGAADAQIKVVAERAWEASPLDVNSSAWKKKFDDETLRFVNRECGALLKALGLRSLGPRVLSSWVASNQDNKTLSPPDVRHRKGNSVTPVHPCHRR